MYSNKKQIVISGIISIFLVTTLAITSTLINNPNFSLDIRNYASNLDLEDDEMAFIRKHGKQIVKPVTNSAPQQTTPQQNKQIKDNNLESAELTYIEKDNVAPVPTHTPLPSSTTTINTHTEKDENIDGAGNNTQIVTTNTITPTTSGTTQTTSVSTTNTNTPQVTNTTEIIKTTDGTSNSQATTNSYTTTTSTSKEKTDEDFIQTDTTIKRDVNTGKVVTADSTSTPLESETKRLSKLYPDKTCGGLKPGESCVIVQGTGQYGITQNSQATAISYNSGVTAGQPVSVPSVPTNSQPETTKSSCIAACKNKGLSTYQESKCSSICDYSTQSEQLQDVYNIANAVTFGGFGAYVNAYQPDKVYSNWEEAGYESREACLATNPGRGAIKCEGYNITKEQIASSIQLGTTLVAEGALVVSGAGFATGAISGTTALSSTIAINAVNQTGIATSTCITDPGTKECYEQAAWAALSIANVGSAANAAKAVTKIAINQARVVNGIVSLAENSGNIYQTGQSCTGTNASATSCIFSGAMTAFQIAGSFRDMAYATNNILNNQPIPQNIRYVPVGDMHSDPASAKAYLEKMGALEPSGQLKPNTRVLTIGDYYGKTSTDLSPTGGNDAIDYALSLEGEHLMGNWEPRCVQGVCAYLRGDEAELNRWLNKTLSLDDVVLAASDLDAFQAKLKQLKSISIIGKGGEIVGYGSNIVAQHIDTPGLARYALSADDLLKLNKINPDLAREYSNLGARITSQDLAIINDATKALNLSPQQIANNINETTDNILNAALRKPNDDNALIALNTLAENMNQELAFYGSDSSEILTQYSDIFDTNTIIHGHSPVESMQSTGRADYPLKELIGSTYDGTYTDPVSGVTLLNVDTSLSSGMRTPIWVKDIQGGIMQIPSDMASYLPGPDVPSFIIDNNNQLIIQK